jgi:hypothetical protein
MSDEIQADEMPQQNNKYLKGSDLVGKFLKAKIVSTGETIFKGQEKPVRNLTVEMDGRETSFTLNKTNIATLVQAYGKSTKNWIGKTVQLTSTKKTNPTTGQLADSIVVIATAY